MAASEAKEWYDSLVEFAEGTLSGEDVCRYYDVFLLDCSFEEYCEAIEKVLMNCGYRYDAEGADMLIKENLKWIENSYMSKVPPSDIAIDMGYCCG